MSTKSLLHQAKLNEWISRFADQKASGLTVAEWCKQNSLSEYKYFYWKRLLKEEAIEQALPDIVPLAMPSAPINPTQVIPGTSELASESSATFLDDLMPWSPRVQRECPSLIKQS